MAGSKPGWFTTDGRPGDRTLQDQLKGLDLLFAECAGKTILDAGSAEGLISIELAKRGAAVAVHGVEIVPAHVAVGNRLKGPLPVTLEVGDLNSWAPRRSYDIVIALAILQKVRDPSALAKRLADAARDTVVLRLPPAEAPDVVDERSGFVRHRIADVLEHCGFELSSTAEGHLSEWVGYFRRFR
jgi:trans-aconitate methyltransferase